MRPPHRSNCRSCRSSVLAASNVASLLRTVCALFAVCHSFPRFKHVSAVLCSCRTRQTLSAVHPCPLLLAKGLAPSHTARKTHLWTTASPASPALLGRRLRLVLSPLLYRCCARAPGNSTSPDRSPRVCSPVSPQIPATRRPPLSVPVINSRGCPVKEALELLPGSHWHRGGFWDRLCEAAGERQAVVAILFCLTSARHVQKALHCARVHRQQTSRAYCALLKASSFLEKLCRSPNQGCLDPGPASRPALCCLRMK